jgi:hypothetical protein
MLLCEIVRKGSLSRTLGTNNQDVEFVFLLNWLRMLDLESRLLLRRKLELDLTFHCCELVTSIRDLLLSLLWWLLLLVLLLLLRSFFLIQSGLFLLKISKFILNLE